MSRITSKLQITLPKAIAVRFGLKPGDEVAWETAGESIRLIPAGKSVLRSANLSDRLKLFDSATRRQRKRQSRLDPDLVDRAARRGRGWRRAGLGSATRKIQS